MLAIGALMWSSATPASAQLATVGVVGDPIPLPGQINELFVDEARGLLYAANFTGGRVEIVSMDSKQRLAAISTSPIPSGTSGMAISPNGRWLIATNQPVTVGVNQLSGIAIINLNDPSDRRHVLFDEEPLGVEFGVNNQAFVVTKGGMYLVDPNDGGARKIYTYGEENPSDVMLPEPPPAFTRELDKVNLHVSGDRKWIFGVAGDAPSGFVFSYRVETPIGLLTIRSLGTMIKPPVFNQVSGSRDGSYFMAGQLLMRNDLRIIADAPEAPDDNLEFLGGTGIDSNIDTVYAAFDQVTPGVGDSPDHPESAELMLMDSDNLYVRQRLRIAERIVGRIIPTTNGRSLYAISDSGILHVPLDRLVDYPMLEVPAAQRHQVFQFDFCSREPVTRTLRIENPLGGAPAKFKLSSPILETRPGLLFEPDQGVTPMDVKVTVDPGAVGPVQGTTTLVVNIETDAVNIPEIPVLVANIRDVDQKGTLLPHRGHLVSAVGDPQRDRVYVLDRQNYMVHIYDTTDMRQIGSWRTGNTPTWMTVDRTNRFLVVANSQGENVTLINLDEMRVMGYVFMPWQILNEGHYPHSVTASNRDIVIASEYAGAAVGQGFKLDFMTLPGRAVSTRETLGVFTNTFGSELAVASHPDGDEVFIAEALGNTYIWETSSQRLIITRQDFQSLGGAIGAGPNYYIVDNHVLNRSLTPMADYPDSSAAHESSGFVLMPNGVGVRSTRPQAAVDTGGLQQIDPADPTRRINSVRMTEPPPARAPDYPFMQTLAALRDGRLVSTSSAGIVEFPVGYETGLRTPRISAVTNGADFTRATATGGLISVFGDDLSASSQGAVDTPLPTNLASTCVSANGAPLPLMYVSPTQINAQMLYTSTGPVSLQVHTVNGVSDVFVKQVDPAAPAIFGVRGPDSARYAAVFRENNTLSTLSNPLRPNEVAVIYATGLGAVTPAQIAGVPASTSIFTQTADMPVVSIGGVTGEILFSGLTPGFVGLYQINVLLPSWTPKGVEVPLTITMGANSTTTNVRIVD